MEKKSQLQINFKDIIFKIAQKEYNLIKHLRIFPEEYSLFYQPHIEFQDST